MSCICLADVSGIPAQGTFEMPNVIRTRGGHKAAETAVRSVSVMLSALASLLALVVCAMTPPGHYSVTAAAEWCRRAAHEELAAFGLPYHPLLGRYRGPSEKTLRSMLGRLDPAELSTAGFAYLESLLPDERGSAPLMPDGGAEREQRPPHCRPGRSAAPQTPGDRGGRPAPARCKAL